MIRIQIITKESKLYFLATTNRKNNQNLITKGQNERNYMMEMAGSNFMSELLDYFLVVIETILDCTRSIQIQ